ncbi:MAG: DUF1018 domain-containing protein [Candidatus Electryoneaceae bacterium]|nr:DUF1018 domain-containing protein [Candidatus Electryoneaceae bacterium]
MNDIISHRRRQWFYECGQLGIDEENQRVIADRIIPDNHPQKCDADGQVSRRLLFSETKLWNQAIKYLNDLQQKAPKSRKDHRRRGRSQRPAGVTSSQLSYLRHMARELGWDDRGEDDMDFRLGRYANRILRDAPRVERNIEWLSSSQASKIIQGLKSMVTSYQSHS